MTTRQLDEEAIFQHAREIDDCAARGRYLDQACEQDHRLRRRVESLLEADQKQDGFLKSVDGYSTPTTSLTGETVGQHIGPYKLLEQIGEGGMGVVFVAEQTQPVRRRVALKIIKPGMDTKQVIARFEAERQALAMMDHPNIAKIFDAGTTGQGTSSQEPVTSDRSATGNWPLATGSRPYFVMELVRGLPITEYCDKVRLSPRQRLELMVDVCHAIQHAHQKGIIHRDLKPSNVLITLHDGQPVVKVIDFGVAKAVGQQLTERTVYTALTQLVGTPLYMSPEQAEMSGLDVDTRSDVYSLGVLLYELLTGQTPFDKETLSKAGFDEMRRIIREDEPETVSARIARTRSAERGSRSESNVPRSEFRALRLNELDWIAMKALEKDRTRRYESPSALAADIQRYLSDEPVLACPPTTMYRFQKFARRHKPALAAAAAIAACLILGTTVSAWQAARATQAEAQANANEQKAVANAATAQEKEQEAIKQRDEVKALADKLAAKEQQLQRTLYAAHMNLAHNAFEAGAPARLRELLAQHRPQPGEPDLRGFEWHYLNRLFPADLLVLQHVGIVRSVTYSPDGRRLATISGRGAGGPAGGPAGELSVWDAQTGKMLFSTKPVGASVTATFSPDGKRVASSSKIWDAETGQELLSLSNEERPVFRAAFTTDGKRLATGTGSPGRPQIAIWDAQTGDKLRTLEGHGDQLQELAFSPDGKRLASASIDKTLKLWDAETGQLVHTLEGHTEAVRGVAYSPDGKRLASTSTDKTVKLWDPLTGNEIRTLRGHTSQVMGVAFSPDSKRLASASDDNTVKVWDVESGDELFALGGHTRPVRSVAFSPDGKHLASASDDGTVKVREARAIQKALVLGGGPGFVTQVAFSPDGKRLTSLDGHELVRTTEANVWDTQTGEKLLAIDGEYTNLSLSLDGRRLASRSFKVEDRERPRIVRNEANIWDLLTGEKLLTIPVNGSSRSIALSPDGNRVVVTNDQVPAAYPQPIQLFDANTGQRIRIWPEPVGSMVFSPDGKRLAGNSRGKTLELRDAQTGDELLTITGAAGAAVFSPDGKRLAGTAEDGTWKLWDVQTGDEILTLKGAKSVGVFSADGKRIAGGSGDATVKKMWDAQTGDELSTLKGHSGAINSVAFSPDNKRLATTSTDATIKVWDSETGQELLTLAGHSGRNNGVAFSPDGLRLAAGGPNGTVMIYDATPLPEKP